MGEVKKVDQGEVNNAPNVGQPNTSGTLQGRRFNIRTVGGIGLLLVGLACAAFASMLAAGVALHIPNWVAAPLCLGALGSTLLAAYLLRSDQKIFQQHYAPLRVMKYENKTETETETQVSSQSQVQPQQ